MYAIYYNDIENCVSEVISIKTWLLVDGINNLILGAIVFLILLTWTSNNDENNNNIYPIAIIMFIPLYILSTFQVAWLIVGSIMFWRDCPNLEPTRLNDFMYAVLIIGYIACYIRMNARIKKQE